MYKLVTQCRLCDTELPPPILRLNDQPAANNLCETADEAVVAPRFPLAITRCPTCTSVQLTASVDPEYLYGQYAYVPTGAVFDQHWRDLAAWCTTGPPGFAVEIGSNRGDLLKALKDLGWDVLGVEPAKNLAAVANERGLPTMQAFFNEQVGDRIALGLTTTRDTPSRADLVLATNVFAHVDDLRSVVRGIRNVLSVGGRFVFEVASLAADLAQGTFDRVLYAEHHFSHSVTPLVRLFETHGMCVRQVSDHPIHGGSLRVVVEHGRDHDRDALARVRAEQLPDGVATAEALVAFADQARGRIDRLRAVIHGYRREGAVVVGFTAPAKASVVINACEFSQDDIAWVADDNPLKVGKFIPGAGIPIVPCSALDESQPDVVVLFAWNLATSLLPRLPKGFRVLIPFPEPHEVLI